MAGQSEQAFMAAIREALTDRGPPAELPDDLEIARVASDDQDCVELFAQRAKDAGMHAYRVADENALPDKIVEIIESAGGTSAIVPEEDLPARDQIVARLKAQMQHRAKEF